MAQLSSLESAGLIRVAQVEPDLQYLFRHVLVQDAAYASLLSTDQRRLHRAVGRAVERLYPDRLDEYAPVLAHHFEQAGETRLAHTYFRRAGDTALAAYANNEAEAHYRSALEHNGRPAAERHAQLLAALGEALYRQSRYEEALESWEQAVQLYQRARDLDEVARLYARSARVVWHQGDHARGLTLCEEGLEAVQGAAESAELALLLHEAGRACYFNNQNERARDFCRRALDMAERCDAAAVQADTLATLGVLPDTPSEEAAQMLGRAVELAESAGHLEIAVRAHHNLAVALRGTLADFDGAFLHFMRAADLAKKRGAAHEEIFSVGAAMGVVLDNGPASEIEALLPRLEHLYRT
ncbi:MAG TPA: tetratricopeptide repeat protein, partial [Anaerolineae bacterium]|nr:tetratricopeptide repeat protein [Anaerolineae bacterium]